MHTNADLWAGISLVPAVNVYESSSFEGVGGSLSLTYPFFEQDCMLSADGRFDASFVSESRDRYSLGGAIGLRGDFEWLAPVDLYMSVHASYLYRDTHEVGGDVDVGILFPGIPMFGMSLGVRTSVYQELETDRTNIIVNPYFGLVFGIV
jgi:hypothetical protein